MILFRLYLVWGIMGKQLKTYCSSQPKSPVDADKTKQAIRVQHDTRESWSSTKTRSFDGFFNPLWDKIQKYMLPKEKSITLFDVGMNTGFWGSHITPRWSHCDYHGFEPFEKTLMQARPKFESQPNVKATFVNAALSNVSGEKELFLGNGEKMKAGNEHFSLGANQHGNEASVGTSVKIQVMTIDDYVMGKTTYPAVPKIDVLKLDVEGFEPLVLQGALNVLSVHRPPVVYLECSKFWQTNHPVGYSVKYVNTLFNRYGYDFFFIQLSNTHVKKTSLMFLGEPFYDSIYETVLGWNNCLAVAADAPNREKFLLEAPFNVSSAVLPFLTRPSDGTCKPNPTSMLKEAGLEPKLLAKNGTLSLTCDPPPCKFRTKEQLELDAIAYKRNQEKKRLQAKYWARKRAELKPNGKRVAVKISKK